MQHSEGHPGEQQWQRTKVLAFSQAVLYSTQTTDLDECHVILSRDPLPAHFYAAFMRIYTLYLSTGALSFSTASSQ